MPINMENQRIAHKQKKFVVTGYSPNSPFQEYSEFDTLEEAEARVSRVAKEGATEACILERIKMITFNPKITDWQPEI